jgi:hypothetical protein
VHQSKLHIAAGGASYHNSLYLDFPSNFTARGILQAYFQVRDAYGNIISDSATASRFQLSAVDIKNQSHIAQVLMLLINLSYLNYVLCEMGCQLLHLRSSQHVLLLR